MSGSGLRWGIAGYGDVVRSRALPALLSRDETVTCIWGRNLARARAVGEAYGVTGATCDYSALLGSVDVVYVATPVVAHVPLAVDAMRAGLPVLIEKPLGGTAPELKAGPEVAVGVAYYRRLAPALRRVREILRGRPMDRATVEFRGAFDPDVSDPKYWRTDPALAGGGVLADVGSHRIDLLCWLLGEPAAVTATVGGRFAAGAERAVRAHLSWDCGAEADLDLRWAPGPARDRLSLAFRGGRLVLDPLDSGHLRGVVDGARVDERLPPSGNPHLPLMDDFVASVLGGTDPVCPAGAAMVVDRVIAAAYRAREADAYRAHEAHDAEESE
jgi:predicted dehydrogenase